MGIAVPSSLSPPLAPLVAAPEQPLPMDLQESLASCPLANPSDKAWQPAWCREYSPELLIK
eukprot:448707-Pyramimonas_sp.AAC.1